MGNNFWPSSIFYSEVPSFKPIFIPFYVYLFVTTTRNKAALLIKKCCKCIWRYFANVLNKTWHWEVAHLKWMYSKRLWTFASVSFDSIPQYQISKDFIIYNFRIYQTADVHDGQSNFLSFQEWAPEADLKSEIWNKYLISDGRQKVEICGIKFPSGSGKVLV